jgi:hypothetical protein
LLYQDMVWRLVALGTLVAGALQNWLVCDRIAHAATRCWKTGLEHPLIGAGRTARVVFTVGSICATIAGLAAAHRVDHSRYRLCSHLGVQMLIAGGLVWFGLIASPLVDLW